MAKETQDESTHGSSPTGSIQRGTTGGEPDSGELGEVTHTREGSSTGGMVDDHKAAEGSDSNSGAFFEQYQYQSIRVAPLPDPDELGRYEQVFPGAAERIFCLTEENAKHQRKIGLIATRAEANAFSFAAFGVAFLPWLLSGMALVLAIAGQQTAAAIVGGGIALSAGPQIIAASRPRNDHSKKER